MLSTNFFQVLISPNRNYATIENIPDAYVYLPHPFSDYEVILLKDFFTNYYPCFTLYITGEYVKTINAEYPEPAQHFVDSCKYRLEMKSVICTNPKALEQQIISCMEMENNVEDEIANICTPRF